MAGLAMAIFIGASCGSSGEECSAIQNKSPCNSEAGCQWNEALDSCMSSCEDIQSQSQCEAIERCDWFLDPAEGDTGEIESCVESPT